MFGTLYPLIYEAMSGGDKISVGAPFFNLIFAPLMIPLLLVLPIAPLLSWKQSDLPNLFPKLYFLFFLTLSISCFYYAWHHSGPTLAPLGIALSIWVLLGSFSEIASRSGFSRLNPRLAITRLIGLPKSMWSTAFAHFGMGVCLLGIVSVTAYESEQVTSFAEGESIQFRDFTITHRGIKESVRDNYQEQLLHLEVKRSDETLTFSTPSQRTFPSRQVQTVEASIHTFLFSQLYITLGETINTKSTITIRWKPLVTLIWLGTIFMISGGFISLLSRRKK